MEQLLDFESNKVQTITLEQLERTHHENDVYGNPICGIYHYELVHNILDMAREQGYNPEVYDMFAAQNKERLMPGVTLLPQVEEKLGKKAVEAHVLRRVFANIRLTDFDDEENTTNIAVAFHQKGIQVGFGNMVKICHNQVMLGAEQYASTFNDRGQGKAPTPTALELLAIVNGWLKDARAIIETEREKIEKMKKIEVGAQEIFTLIGMLTAIRVKRDTRKEEIKELATYPLSQAQISQFTETLLLDYKLKERITVWDIYNAATNLYKADGMDIPNLLPQNRAMVKVLEEQFGI